MILAGLSDFLTGDLTDWVIDVIDAMGYLGVAFLVALENLFPPIPSEVVLPAAGIWANDGGRGAAELLGMIVAATIGSVVGAWLLYLIGAGIGEDRLRAFVHRWGRWFGVKEKDFDTADAWFDRHEELAVLVCRCIPLVRSVVSVPAGLRRMNPVRFTLYTAIGSGVWNVALIMVGFFARERWDTVQTVMGYAQYVVVLAILGAIAWFVWRRIVLVRLHPEDADPELVPPDLLDDVEEIHRREALEGDGTADVLGAGDTGSGHDGGHAGTA
ncbi:MAG: DedA family protein [Acidimicrobiales bacterium]|nr:DedA family protein [Acidimicrobiales bacterium]